MDGDRFTDAFVVDEDLSFRLALTDLEGLKSQAITVYRFTVRPDDPPTVQITRPGEDVVLERDLRVTIEGVAADDVGLSRLELLYRPSEETEWSRRELTWRDRSSGSIRKVMLDGNRLDAAMGVG